MLLAGQFLIALMPALWLALGAVENIRNPEVNRASVAEVCSMSRMRAVYPEQYAVFCRNRVEDPRVHAWMFRAILWAECAVAVLFLAGAGALGLAVLGAVPAEAAKTLAMVGAAGFSAVWAGFLVGGQWFHYWCGFESAQATHFAATLWGIGTFLALAV